MAEKRKKLLELDLISEGYEDDLAKDAYLVADAIRVFLGKATEETILSSLIPQGEPSSPLDNIYLLSKVRTSLKILEGRGDVYFEKGKYCLKPSTRNSLEKD